MKNTVQLDELDRRILRALQRDASESHVALAESVGSSPASCWRRIRALEESGVLRQTVRLVDPDAVGCAVNIICHVRLKSHAETDGDSFEKFVASRSEIMDCYSMSGEWDYLLRIVAADVADYERFLMRVLLRHPAVATASSNFALRQVKHATELPV